MSEDEITAAAIAAGCACATAWPELAVTRDDGTSETVLASDTPGPLARLYYAHCDRCGVQYPGPFRLPPRTACHTGRTGGARAWQSRCPAPETRHDTKGLADHPDPAGPRRWEPLTCARSGRATGH
ncbi:hypothetical protein DMP23_47735 [Amycolatopsis sp. A1MSW2902]|uniref:hypothetical protein n=1 Tax=Amycolatopsis sp. A1MSW2902 TaxID=687413 RepID=UPI00307DAF25